jgi:hypothetical protein
VKASGSFLTYFARPDSDGRLRRPSSERENQKTSLLWGMGATLPTPQAQSQKVFLLLFLQKKKVFLALVIGWIGGHQPFLLYP